MTVRLHVPLPLHGLTTLTLPPGASRHVQVLRLQPGECITVFDGRGGEWTATISDIGRRMVDIELGERTEVTRELDRAVTLAVGMPANDRMDDLVEKATELGVARLQPLVTERSVLRLGGERADRKRLHWQGVAAAASEQSGRTHVPHIEPVRSLGEWLATLGGAAADAAGTQRLVLSLRTPQPLAALVGAASAVCFLSGPEGGLGPAEEDAALAHGFAAVSLGPRTLRADTAPLAALAYLALAARSA
jgi:16S rRNA (uracil1498-N3)-methyltransferase